MFDFTINLFKDLVILGIVIAYLKNQLLLAVETNQYRMILFSNILLVNIVFLSVFLN